MELYNFKAMCLRVVDGDTIDVEFDLGFDITYKERVRVLGIDTPECRTKNLLEKDAGLSVKAYLQQKIEGKYVYITTKLDGNTGKYGRLLGTIYEHRESTESINAKLLRMGLAREYTGGKRNPWNYGMLNEMIDTVKLMIGDVLNKD